MLVFRSSDFFLVNVPQNMRMGLYGELKLNEISNNANELVVEDLFQSRDRGDTFVVLKNGLIFKISDQFNNAYGPVRLVADYADKILHNKTYAEWMREINSCLPKEIIDFRFNGLPETGI